MEVCRSIHFVSCFFYAINLALYYMIFSFVLFSIYQQSILNQIKLVNSGKHNFQLYQYKNVNKNTNWNNNKKIHVICYAYNTAVIVIVDLNVIILKNIYILYYIKCTLYTIKYYILNFNVIYKIIFYHFIYL